jgi:hypothetical protein
MIGACRFGAAEFQNYKEDSGLVQKEFTCKPNQFRNTNGLTAI